MKQSYIIVALLVLVGSVIAFVVTRQRQRQSETLSTQPIVLRGACQFDEEHAFTRTLRRFEELVQQYYEGPVQFELYRNSELGLEKDYFAYMSQGISVDYAIVSPAHMSTFSPAAPLMDMPFLFRDLEHWERVLSSDALQPIVDEIATNADVHLIGFAGGGTRNLIATKPVTNLQQLTGLSMRVMGAPVQTRIFQALGAAPTVIAYNEVYNAIQTGVIEAAENEAAGMQQMKFYEVGPDISLTQHAITVRPICFSGKTLQQLPPALQQAIDRAGSEAGAYGRQLESQEDGSILQQLKAEQKIRVHVYEDRQELLELAAPVKTAYAAEIGAELVLERVNDIR